MFLSTLTPVQLGILEVLCLRDEARKRVERGATFLDKHAPGWRLQMMDIVDGKVFSRVRTTYNTENALALGFRGDPSIIGFDGRPLYGLAVQKFKRLNTEPAASLADFGFDGECRLYGDVCIDGMVDGELLDEAWAKLLSNLRWSERVPVAQHQAA